MLDPKTALPQFAEPARGGLGLQVLALGLLFVGLGVVTDGAYALSAGLAGRWLRAGGGIGAT